MSDKPYVNQTGVNIRVRTDKGEKEHIDIYDRNPREEEHKSIHITIDTKNENAQITDTMNESGKTERTDVDCYLTTACMLHYSNSFDDNCYELSVLRWFRDNFVSKEDIEHYYRVAPFIVSEINKEQKSNIVYDYIYDNIVDACVEAIEQGNYDFAYNIYKSSIIALEEHYVRPSLEQDLVKVLKIQVPSV